MLRALFLRGIELNCKNIKLSKLTALLLAAVFMFSVPCTEVGAQNVGADSIGIESAANIGDILKSIAAIVKKLGLFNEKEPSQTYEQ